MRSPKQRRRQLIAVGVAAVAVMSGVTACSGSTDSATDNAAKGSKLKITVISGALADPFFSAMKAGTAQAGKDLGVDVTWSAPKDFSNVGPDFSRLGDAAFASKPDALVLSYFIPAAQQPSLDKFLAAEIPVVHLNSGPAWEKAGGLNVVGEDSRIVGAETAKRFLAAGKKRVICVNHAAGVELLEIRCKALDRVMKAAGGSSTMLNIPLAQAGNPTVLGSAISGALRADKSVDGVWTLGSGVAEAAARVIKSSGSTAMLATTDLSTNVLNLIKSGEIAFSSDQQPYLEGYYAVLIAAQYLQTGMHPIGWINTAPNFITKENADQVLKSNKDNDGIRGAA